MKKPHVLNRPMFTKGGISAYGRGITSNLVTEEQRQRFNYGGRVGLLTGGNYGSTDYYDPDSYKVNENIVKSIIDYPIGSGRGATQDYVVEDETVEEETPTWGAGTYASRNIYKEPTAIEKHLEDKAKKRQEEKRLELGSMEDPLIISEEEDGPPPPEKKIMADSDTMDWEELLGPTEEQKKRTKGEAQLGLAAGALDVFSQPSIAKGMKAASPHLLNLGKTATADQKAREKAVLQGKILDKVYRGREEEKGKQKRMESGDANAWEIFQASYAKDKNADKGIMVAIGETVTVLDEKDGKPIMPTGAKPGRVFRHKKQYYVTDNQGIPQPIDNIKAWLESV